MNDLEDRLHDDLARLAAHMPATDITESSVRRGRRQRFRRRSAIATGGIAFAVAALAPFGLYYAYDTHSLVAHRNHPIGNPTRPARPFQVAGPPFTVIGGVGARTKDCRAGPVKAFARFQPTTGGMSGVLVVRGHHHCNLGYGIRHVVLLDRRGRPVGVPTRPNPDQMNQATNPRPDLWFSAGEVSLGLSWRGSWCGRNPVTVAFDLSTGAHRAPIMGLRPRLPCTGESHAVLIPGAYGRPGSPVQGAPPDWRFLRARLTVPGNSTDGLLRDMVVRFTNRSDTAIRLDPPPNYIIGVRAPTGEGTEAEFTKPLPLDGDDLVPARSNLDVPLPTADYGPDWPAFKLNQVITVTFSIAGVPSATATTINH
jgi:hypothetical protein